MAISIKVVKKKGNGAGEYEILISEEDKDLLETSWFIEASKNTRYATCSRESKKAKYNSIRMHRIILSRVLVRDLLPDENVDHIDGNSLNNCRTNLRLATRSQNAMNMKSRGNATGYKGITFDKRNGTYVAVITVNYKRFYVGFFKTAEEANEARIKELPKYHGEYARPE